MVPWGFGDSDKGQILLWGQGGIGKSLEWVLFDVGLFRLDKMRIDKRLPWPYIPAYL